jgi:hypothetical protein
VPPRALEVCGEAPQRAAGQQSPSNANCTHH